MPRSKLLVLAGCCLLAAAVPVAGVLADDEAEDSATYEVDFYNYAGDGGPCPWMAMWSVPWP